MKLLHLLLLSLLALSTLAPLRAGAEPREIDRVVAIVNEHAVSRTELTAETETVKLHMAQQRIPIPPPHILEKQVLERLVVKHLQIELARLNNIIIDEDALNSAIRRIAEQNDMSLRGFRQVLENDGYDFNRFREDIRMEMLATRLRQRFVDARVSISEAEIDQFLEQQKSTEQANDEYRLGHILVAVPEEATPEQVQAAKTQAQAVLDQLRQGADFTQLATRESAGQQALSGGDLGWRKAGQLPTLFASIAPGMSVGDLSDLIRSPSGFHIIKLLDHRGGARHMVTQTHARHILIKPDELTTDGDARRKLTQLRDRIENGNDFAELARAHSADRGSAANGGDLGWTTPGQMVPTFEAAMDALAIGEVSVPFQSQFGWHIIEVLGRRDHDDTEEFRRNNARKQLLDRKITEEEDIWLQRLRDEAYVEILLDT